MKRAAIYARLSDEDKDKSSYTELSESIKNQIALAAKYAQERGWVITDVYYDDDWSGLDRDRPEFNRLLKSCEDGKHDIVLCKDMSRFTRDKIVTEEYLETKFPEWNVRFIGLADGCDTANKANKKSREINALVNQWYAEDISNKVRAAFKVKRAQGCFIGSYPAYGYMKSTASKSKLVIDPEAAQIVRKIFTLYLAGYGTTAIARMLNEEAIPNPAVYKKLKDPSYRNALQRDERGLWSKTSVKRILRNEVYLGNLVQHKNEKIHFKTKKRRNLPRDAWEIVEGTHEPIIDRQVFCKVQTLLNSKVRSTGAGTPHLFAGKVYCKDCGNAMVKSSSGSFSYLVCSLYRRGPSLCSRHSIRLDLLTVEVERCLGGLFRSLLKGKKALLQQLRNKDDYTAGLRNLKSKIEGIEGRVRQVTDALKTLYLDIGNGKIDRGLFEDLKAEFTKEKSQLDKQLMKWTKELNTAAAQTNRTQYWRETLDSYANHPKLTRELVNELIKRVEIGEKQDCLQEIVLYYNFRSWV